MGNFVLSIKDPLSAVQWKEAESGNERSLSLCEAKRQQQQWGLPICHRELPFVGEKRQSNATFFFEKQQCNLFGSTKKKP
jgi:hypothetical protein